MNREEAKCAEDFESTLFTSFPQKYDSLAILYLCLLWTNQLFFTTVIAVFVIKRFSLS